MDFKIYPSNLKGKIYAPSSKSLLHRAIIAAAFCDKKSTLKVCGISLDVLATLSAIKSLGGDYKIEKEKITVYPIIPLKNKVPIIDAKSSASTLRFILPLSTLLYEKVKFKGNLDLASRPILPLLTALKSVRFNSENLPLISSGKLRGNSFNIDGSLSSEYVSGMLFALSVMPTKSTLKVKGEISPYVYMTVKVLSDFGIKIVLDKSTFTVYGGSWKSRKNYKIEGDYSNASFFIIAKEKFGNIKIKNLNKISIQGDKNVYSLIEKIKLKNKIDLSDNPDLLPVLSVYSASLNKKTTFTGIERLKYKESDRIKSVSKMLTSLGVKVISKESNLTVMGNGVIYGGKVKTYSDHRIVFGAVLASIFSKNEIEIDDMKCVEKSYPNFFNDFIKLGGKTNAI